MVKTLLLFSVILTSTLANAKDFTQVKFAAKKLAPQVSKIENYAFWVHTYAEKYQIDPFIMLALIKVESDFNQEAISETGDYSLAQINFKVWQKELSSKGIKLDYSKLKKNHTYALEKMAIILNILKTRHAKKDNNWYGRYHSNTKKYKNKYLKKVNIALMKMKNNSRSIAQQ